eukprot:TRINITY_DN2485_c0_g4_i1.p1 TRINITY_DN2485_c0_g4~~TRINITY_DN2485_c0_g4_i1.p1  ORF type:complete len:913 (+),score=253.10 TRINITY_DN2485_c0_g4_i1:367-2739(+)
MPEIALTGVTDRDMTLHEIYTSEIEYVTGLDVLYEYWIVPMKSKKISNAEDLRVLFLTIENIRNFNHNFIGALAPRVSQWNEMQKIADVFTDNFQYFDLYKTYCADYEDLLIVLEKVLKKEKFQKFSKGARLQSSGSQLPELLRLPTQRISRYNVLLKRLLSSTDSGHPDFSNLGNAVASLEELHEDTSENVSNAQNNRALEALLNKNLVGIEELMADHRILLFDGARTASYNSIDCSWIIVFNDIIAFAATNGKEKGKNPKRYIQGFLPFDVCWVNPVEGLGEETFELKTPEQTMLIRVRHEANELKKKKVGDGLSEKVNWFEEVAKGVYDWLINPDSPDGVKNHQIMNEDPEQRIAQYFYIDGSSYYGGWKMAKYHGPGRFTSANGSTFEGNFERGALTGPGIVSYATGEIFEGEWSKDLPNGFGKLVYPNGRTYEGNFVIGKKKGQGTLIWENGDTYVGEWDMDRMNGAGELNLKEKDISYKGNFKNGERHGSGTLTKGNTYAYSGGWQNNLKHGNGKEVSIKGTYEGEFEYGARVGEGSFVSADGVISYEGFWCDDVYNGKGKLTNTNLGYTYEGSFKDGRKHGKGKQTWNTGEYYDGDWEEDVITGEGHWRGANGDEYEGSFHIGCKFGTGKYTWSDGSSYEGDWFRNKQEGPGKMIYADGRYYDGTWLNGLMHGEGVFHYSENSSYNGSWDKGMRHGRGTYSNVDGVYTGGWVKDRRDGEGEIVGHDGSTFKGTFKDNVKVSTAIYVTSEGKTINQVWKDGVMMTPGIKYFAPVLPAPYIIEDC